MISPHGKNRCQMGGPLSGGLPIILAFLFTASQAWALELGGYAGLNMTSFTNKYSTSSAVISEYSPNMGFSLGANAQLNLIPSFLDLDLQALFSYNSCSLALAGSLGTSAMTFSTLSFPIIARFPVLPYIEPGLGFYFGFGMGSVSTQIGTQTATTQTFLAAGMGNMNYGPIISIKGGFPLSESMRLYGEGRYLMGMANLNSSTLLTTSSSSLQFMAGLQFTLGGSKSSDEDSYTPRKKSSARSADDDEEEPIKPAPKKKSSTKSKSR